MSVGGSNRRQSRPAGAPQIAAMIAIADQGRGLNGAGTLDTRSQLLPSLYTMPTTNFHDITAGASTGSPSYVAAGGYDLATGIGTPKADLVVDQLVTV